MGNKIYVFVASAVLLMISTTSVAAELFDLLVEPDDPTPYDKINLFIKPSATFTANITITSNISNIAGISLTKDSEYDLIRDRFFAKGTYDVKVTNASDSNNTETESFSVKDPVATSGKCGDRICQLEENSKNCFNDCYNLVPSSGKVCYELTGQKIYFHFGNLFNDSNYTLSNDVERLGSEESYDADTKLYCVERDSGDLNDNEQFYISRNGRNWNVFIYGERVVPEDKCGSASDCDDSDPCTKDSCIGIPKDCVHEKILICPICGDNTCDSVESQSSCPKDCGCPAGKVLSGSACVENQTAPGSVCGDSICSSDESSSTCCSDCSCAAGYSCVSNSCELSQGEVAVASAPEESGGSGILIIAIIGVVLIASLGVLFVIRIMHKKAVPDLSDYVKSMRMQGYTDEQIKEQMGRFYSPETADKILKNNPR